MPKFFNTEKFKGVEKAYLFSFYLSKLTCRSSTRSKRVKKQLSSGQRA